MDYKITAPQRIVGEIDLPASKSMSNRALLLNALSEQQSKIANVAQCDDTEAVARALNRPQAAEVNVGRAGTAMRFLTAYYALQQGRTVTLDGDARMRVRPIGILVDALRQLGASIEYARQEGFPPLKITGTRLRGGTVTMRGDVSSQFTSAILMIAPIMGGLRLHLTGEITSRPYIDMTLGLMRRWGIPAQWAESHIIDVPGGQYMSANMSIESDWSAASYWYALQALLPESHITLRGLSLNSLQGDCRIAEIMAQMGVKGREHDGHIDLLCDRPGLCCCSTFADMSGTPDLAPTLVVTLCLLGRSFRITGLRTLRIKESNRLEALRTELMKLGYVVKIESNDSMSWHFERCTPLPQPRIATHGDHRMAMALSLASVKHPGLVIEDAEVVSKSYPQFWEQMRNAGFRIV